MVKSFRLAPDSQTLKAAPITDVQPLKLRDYIGLAAIAAIWFYFSLHDLIKHHSTWNVLWFAAALVSLRLIALEGYKAYGKKDFKRAK